MKMNAAINIRKEGLRLLEDTLGLREIFACEAGNNACGEASSTSDGNRKQDISVKQEKRRMFYNRRTEASGLAPRYVTQLLIDLFYTKIRKSILIFL